MMYPPSLPQDVKARAFVAGNGELGILPTDAQAFLDACRTDDVELLGWELWIVRHRLSLRQRLSLKRLWGGGVPNAAPTSWSGGIPLRNASGLSIVGGDGDVDETEAQLAAFNIEVSVQPKWVPYVRVNFTLDD